MAKIYAYKITKEMEGTRVTSKDVEEMTFSEYTEFLENFASWIPELKKVGCEVRGGFDIVNGLKVLDCIIITTATTTTLVEFVFARL